MTGSDTNIASVFEVDSFTRTKIIYSGKEIYSENNQTGFGRCRSINHCRLLYGINQRRI